MTEERIVEHPDGTTERTIDHGGSTTVVERRGGSGALIALVLLLAVAVGAWFLFQQNRSTSSRDNAIAGAAKSIGAAADKAGDAVSNGS